MHRDLQYNVLLEVIQIYREYETFVLLLNLESGIESDETSNAHNKLNESYELKDLNKPVDQIEPEETDEETSGNHTNGLGVFTAGIFIIGEICGAGAISFPKALSKTGIFGKSIL